VIAFITLGFSVLFFITNKVYLEIIKKPTRDEDPIFNKLYAEMVLKMSSADQMQQPLFGFEVNQKPDKVTIGDNFE
jgi:hypothetical protein